LTAQLALAQDFYPKKLIIQSSKNKDTVIAFTNEQVIKINQEHVVLKQCIDYSNLQDSTIKFQSKTIEELKVISSSYIALDSISRESIKIQSFMLQSSYKEKQQLQETFTKYQKKKKKRNNWFYNTFITIPVVVVITSVVTFLIIK
jgi:hypothetical protein